MDIHKRKIQQFAKYSYAVTLPIHWIKRHHLDRVKKDNPNGTSMEGLDNEKIDKNEPVLNLYEMADGSLQIFPEPKIENHQDNITTIDLDEMLRQNPSFIEDRSIKMILISCYMNGQNGIQIVSKQPLPDSFIDQIERTQDKLLFNWNTSRITNRKLLIKNVFTETPENIFQAEIPRYLRESFIILLGMIEDIEEALNENRYEDLKSIPARDDKIDRYYFFIVRQIRTIFENPQIAKPVTYTHKRLIDLRLLSKNIEEVGDLLKDISQTLISLQNFIKDINLLPYLTEFFKQLREAYTTIADLLIKSVTQTDPLTGMGLSIMPAIQNYRNKGKQLYSRWEEIAKGIKINELHFAFISQYDASRLVYSMRHVYDKLFDFTNLFF